MQSLAIQQVAKTYIVRKGETISRIAKKFDCTPDDIRAWNNLRSVKLHTGQRLTVYVIPKGTVSTASAKITPADTISMKPEMKTSVDSNKVTPTGTKFRYVTVQRGNSLWSIAQENGVTVQQLKQWNNLDDGKIIVGQKIKILISQ
jgi:peptidoglycan endopeptidase LytE